MGVVEELALGVLVENQHLPGVLKGVVVPPLLGGMDYSRGQVVEGHESKVDGILDRADLVGPDGAGVHDGEGIVADLGGVDGLPDAEEDAQLAVVVVHLPHEVVGLCLHSQPV